MKTEGSSGDPSLGPRAWLRWGARLGYVTIGVVYVIIALIAGSAVIGWGGYNANPRHALESLESGPVGAAALIAIGVGMAGYGAWRLVAAITDPEHVGHGPGGILQRAGFVLSGVMHFSIAYEAFQFAAGATGAAHPSQSTNDSASGWTADAMRIPGGRWLVIAVGVGIVIFGFYEAYRSVRWKIRELLRTSELSPAFIDATVYLARLGMAVRAVVIVTIGVYVAWAAITYDPERAAGVAKAFAAIGSWRYGRLAVGITAIGFAAYGVYQVLMGWARRVRVR